MVSGSNIKLLAAIAMIAVQLTLSAVSAAEQRMTHYQARTIIATAQAKGAALTANDVEQLHNAASRMKHSNLEMESRQLLQLICNSRHARAAYFCELADTYSDALGDSTGQAYSCYRNALKLDPDCSRAYAGLTELELIQGNKEKAMQYAKKAIASKSPTNGAYLMYADVLSSLKRYNEALAAIAQAERIDSNYAEIFRVKGSILENLGRFGEAVSAYRQANLIQKKDWTTFQITRCLEAQKKYGEAIKEMDKLISINPKDGEAFRTRAGLKIKNKDLKGSLKDLDQTIELEPTTRGYTERARLHDLMGRPDLAKKDRETVKRIREAP